MPDTINAPWFNAQHLPAVPTPAYVAWLDVMGAKGAMLRSLPVAANFVFKLHVTALEDSTNYPGLRLYPVLLQLHVFRRFDFVSMLSLRLVYYVYWHLIWGAIRLRVLF